MFLLYPFGKNVWFGIFNQNFKNMLMEKQMLRLSYRSFNVLKSRNHDQ